MSAMSLSWESYTEILLSVFCSVNFKCCLTLPIFCIFLNWILNIKNTFNNTGNGEQFNNIQPHYYVGLVWECEIQSNFRIGKTQQNGTERNKNFVHQIDMLCILKLKQISSQLMPISISTYYNTFKNTKQAIVSEYWFQYSFTSNCIPGISQLGI